MTQLIDLGKLRFYFTGQWDATTQYEINDIVKYGGNVYVYTYTLADVGYLPTDTSHWQLLIEGIRFQGDYSATRTYKVGEGVAYGGTVYLNIADSTGVLPTQATNWTKFLDGIQYEGTYSATTAYQRSDMVTYGPNAYIAKSDTTGNLPTNNTFWTQLLSGISVTGAYNASTAYTPGQVVAYGTRLYQAVANVTGTAPASSAGTVNANWQLFVDSIRPRGVWGGSVAYYINDVVTRGGTSYIAIMNHTSTSASPPPVNTTNWAKFNSGVRWRGQLAASTPYLVDDLVYDGVSTYIVTADTTTGTSTTASDYAGLTLLARGADYLPNQAGQGTKFLTTNGTSPSWAYAGYVYKTINATTTAAVADALLCDTSQVPFTVTLPAAPAVGNAVRFADLAGTWDTRPVTILRNGSLINGVADDLIANVRNSSIELVYSGATYGWKVL